MFVRRAQPDLSGREARARGPGPTEPLKESTASTDSVTMLLGSSIACTLAPHREGAIRQGISRLARSRAHRVLCLIAAVWVLNGFDLILTLLAHRQHLLYEVNPLAQYLLSHGELSLALFKFGLLAIGTYALAKYRRERISELGCIMVMGVYALVALHWHFCYEMYAMTINCGPDVVHLWQPTQASVSPLASARLTELTQAFH